jgi:hypothetical protein
MKAIIATFGDTGAVDSINRAALNHLWLVEGWVSPSQLDIEPTCKGFISNVSDRRAVVALCGKYRNRVRLGYWRGGELVSPIIGWLYSRQGKICKRCQAVAWRRGIGMGHHKVGERNRGRQR